MNMVTSIPFLIARVTDDDDFLRLKEMASVHDDWNLDYDKNSIKIWSKTIPDVTVKMVKVWALFSALNSLDVYNTLMDPLYRKQWDTHMIIGYDIGHLNPNNLISYYAVSCPPPLKSRDFVLQTSWLNRGAEHYILNHSVCHKDHPPRQSFIRAISYFTGFFIKCIPCNGCEMSFVSQTDPQGFIPAWAVNKFTQMLAPRFVRQIEKAAFGYSSWKSLNNPNYSPWLNAEQMKTPKISVADCVPSEEEKQSSFFRYLVVKSSKMLDLMPKAEDIAANRNQLASVVTAGTSKASITACDSKGTKKAVLGTNESNSDSKKAGIEKCKRNFETFLVEKMFMIIFFNRKTSSRPALAQKQILLLQARIDRRKKIF